MIICRLRKFICLILTAFCINLVVSTLSFAEDYPSVSILEIENQAFQEFKDGAYQRASQSYDQLRILLHQEHYSAFQPDLLYNQALTHYHMGNPALALAEFKQAYLLTNDEIYQTYIDQLQELLELRAHKAAPNTVFMRGDSDEYMYWSIVQYYPHENLRWAEFITLCLIFALISGIIKIKKKSPRILMGILLSYFIVFYTILGIISGIQLYTAKMSFAVVLDADIIRNEPRNEAAPMQHESAFLPGITVQVISKHDTWMLIQRMDGLTAWIPSEGLYPLKTPNFQ